MLLPEEFESNWPVGEDVRWCIRRSGAQQTLCEARVVRSGWFSNALGPKDLATLHRVCLDVLLDEVTQRVGVCQVCDAEVALDGERVGPHGGCAGVNMAPRGVS